MFHLELVMVSNDPFLEHASPTESFCTWCLGFWLTCHLPSSLNAYLDSKVVQGEHVFRACFILRMSYNIYKHMSDLL